MYIGHKKEYWPVIAARIPPDLKEKLKNKHPNNGEISRVIHQLIERYLRGQILGIDVKQKRV